ncbi:hypothetical protein D3C85_1706180 [compost metagenome]
MQHLLRRGDDAHHRAVFGYQHIAAAHGLAARQEDGQFAALRVGCGKAAFLAHVPVEFDGRCTLQQDTGQAFALGDEFLEGEHLGICGLRWRQWGT